MCTDTFKRERHNAGNAQVRTATSTKKAQLYVTRAQQYATHLQLGEEDMHEEHKYLTGDMTTLRTETMKTFTSLKGGRDGAKKLLSLLDQSSESLRDQSSIPNYSDYSISVLIMLQKWVALCWF